MARKPWNCQADANIKTIKNLVVNNKSSDFIMYRVGLIPSNFMLYEGHYEPDLHKSKAVGCRLAFKTTSQTTYLNPTQEIQHSSCNVNHHKKKLIQQFHLLY